MLDEAPCLYNAECFLGISDYVEEPGRASPKHKASRPVVSRRMIEQTSPASPNSILPSRPKRCRRGRLPLDSFRSDDLDVSEHAKVSRTFTVHGTKEVPQSKSTGMATEVETI